MIGTFTFKREEPGTAVAHYKGPAGDRKLCYMVKVDKKWVVPGMAGTFKDRWHAAYAYLKDVVCDPTTKTIEAETGAAWDKTRLQTRRGTSLTETEAVVVYDLLVEKCRVNFRDREGFVLHHTKITNGSSEWRFRGLLGFGGKFYATAFRWYVSNYVEDGGPEESLLIAETNRTLQEMYAKSGVGC